MPPPAPTPPASPNTPTPANQAFQAFGGLIGSVIRVSTGLAGMTTIVSAIGSGLKAVGNSLQIVGGLFYALVSPLAGLKMVGTGVLNLFTNLVTALGKAIFGLFTLGAAAAPQGIQTFAKVLEYLTSVIGSVATPIFTVLTAAVLTLADVLMGPMLQATDAVAKWLADHLVGAIKGTITFFVNLIDIGDLVITKLRNFGDYMLIVAKMIQLGFTLVMAGLSKAAAYILDFIPGLGNASKALEAWSDSSTEASSQLVDEIDGVLAGIDKRNEEQGKRSEERRKSVAAGGGIDTAINGLLKMFGLNISSVITEMRRGMGANANVGFSGLTDVQKTIQTQAFQSSISSRQLNVQQAILDKLSAFASRFQGNVAGQGAIVQ